MVYEDDALVQGSLTEYHNLDGLNNKCLLLIVLEVGKSQDQGTGRFGVW